MHAPERLEQPCYSVRLVLPFLALLRSQHGLTEGPEQTWQADDRIPIAIAHDFLQNALEFTGDPDLGLKAGQQISFGDGGALDYLVCSGATVNDALEVAARYMRLLNDALKLSVEPHGAHAAVRLESTVTLPRAAVDFQLSALFMSYWRSWLGAELARVQVAFTHSAPASTAEYEATFAPATVRFGAPFNGFIVPRELLDLPLERADSRLHDVIRALAERMLSELPRAQSTTESVRRLLSAQLPEGEHGAEVIARKLGMSTRTLGRRLESEGTTYKELLEDVRKRLALEYVGSHDLSFTEVALLLGFAQTPAFYRAFRRWTGQTPLEYRKLRWRVAR